MISSLGVDRDVNVDDVSILNLAEIWDAMANDLVHRSAHGFWEVVVIQRTGIHVPLNASLVNDPINLISRHTNTKCFSGNVQHFPTHGTGMTESILCIELLGAIHTDRVVGCPIPLFRHGNALKVIGVVRTADRRWHHPTRTQHRRAERPREVIRLRPRWKSLFDILGRIERTCHPVGRRLAMPPTALGRDYLLCELVNALVLFPVGLEAFLAAKVRRWHAQLNTRRASQRLVYDLGTSGRGTFARHGWLCN